MYNGGMTAGDITVLQDIAGNFTRKMAPLFLEIGAWAGRSTVALLEANKEAHVYSVDPFTGSPDVKEESDITGVMESWIKNTEPYRNRCHLLMMSSADAARIVGNNLSLVFIDGDHSYNSVKFDIAVWRRKLNLSGVICGHDYDCMHFDVRRAVEEEFAHDFIVKQRIWYHET